MLKSILLTFLFLKQGQKCSGRCVSVKSSESDLANCEVLCYKGGPQVYCMCTLYIDLKLYVQMDAFVSVFLNETSVF